MEEIYNLISIPEANEIVKNLWIGDIRSSRNPVDFDVVINATHDLPFSSAAKIRYRVAVKDNRQLPEIIKMTYHLPKIVNIIKKEMCKGRRVLVHCRGGAQRSATIVTAYLIKYHGMSLQNAMLLVKSKRMVAFFPFTNFRLSLTFFDKSTLFIE